MRATSNKRFLCVVLLVLLTIVLCTTGCTGNTPTDVNTPTSTSTASPTLTYVPKNNPGYQNYGNLTMGFTIQYPHSWKVMEAPIMEFILFAGRTGESLYISGDYGGENLEKFSQYVINSMLDPDDHNILLSSSNTTVAGSPAIKTIWETKSTEDTLTGNVTIPKKMIIIFTIKNNQGYEIGFTAPQQDFDAYLEIGENMIQSFNFIG